MLNYVVFRPFLPSLQAFFGVIVPVNVIVKKLLSIYHFYVVSLHELLDAFFKNSALLSLLRFATENCRAQ